MEITLIHYTGKQTMEPMWYAARLLAFSKNTRLQMTPDGLNKFMTMSPEELKPELEYMSSTIASSWELISVMFAINGVSRACAQQITRTRQASYAMQSQRVTNMKDVTAHIPTTVAADRHKKTIYEFALSAAIASYDKMVNNGIALEDARGVLPMNVHCNLIAKYNFRAWVDLIRARDSLRVQDEYHDVILAMKKEVLKVWPWAATFIEPKDAKAIALMEELAKELPPEQKTRLAKAADLLKKETA
jgi:flavin-dependent thymidylate synthase